MGFGLWVDGLWAVGCGLWAVGFGLMGDTYIHTYIHTYIMLTGCGVWSCGGECVVAFGWICWSKEGGGVEG